MNNNPILELKNVHRTYKQGGTELHVLEDISCRLYAGESVALLGASGVGKSSLLHIAGLLEVPTAGQVSINGEAVAKDYDLERTKLRLNYLGYVYQHHYLQSEFSALENINIPQMIKGLSIQQATQRSLQLLEELGLSARKNHRPAQLSGGEQQRVAIGRALANSPKILIADEPTGNLDPETSLKVFDLLLQNVRKNKFAALIATHNYDLANRMDRIFLIKNKTMTEM